MKLKRKQNEISKGNSPNKTIGSSQCKCIYYWNDEPYRFPSLEKLKEIYQRIKKHR